MKRTFRILAYWGLAFVLHGGLQAYTEESFYYWAPIAVAVVLTLLEMRQAKRAEGQIDGLQETFHALHKSLLVHGAAVEKSLAIVDKVLERYGERLDALEGQDTGVPKETGEKLATDMQELRHNLGQVAIAYNNVSARVDAVEDLVPELGTEDKPKRKRGRR